jgi:hypothetical protein
VYATADRPKTLPISPVLGILAVAGDVALLVAGVRKRACRRFSRTNYIREERGAATLLRDPLCLSVFLFATLLTRLAPHGKRQRPQATFRDLLRAFAQNPY